MVYIADDLAHSQVDVEQGGARVLSCQVWVSWFATQTTSRMAESSALSELGLSRTAVLVLTVAHDTETSETMVSGPELVAGNAEMKNNYLWRSIFMHLWNSNSKYLKHCQRHNGPRVLSP